MAICFSEPEHTQFIVTVSGSIAMAIIVSKHSEEHSIGNLSNNSYRFFKLMECIGTLAVN